MKNDATATAPLAPHAWYDALTRGTPDVAGKPVDVHALPEVGRAFVYDLESSLSREQLRDEVVIRLLRMRRATAKVVRDRRFNVWYGTARTMHGGPVAAVMFPKRFDIRAWRYVADLRGLAGALEQTSFPAWDLDGGPLVRYDRGSVIAYGDPSEPPGALHKGEVETRSAVVVRRQVVSRARTWMLPPRGTAHWLHNLETWPANRARILDFVWQLRAAGTYERLRELTIKRLGISVVEETMAWAGTYGRVRLGWLRGSDESLPIAVFLHEDLPSELKYVVLAHEISHYTLHFPVLHLGAVVDDIARLVPELGLAFRLAAARYIDADLMEDQADHLASSFLIPPRYDLRWLSDIYAESGGPVSAEEHAWRFLRPLFPDTEEPIGWSNLEEMRARARYDLDAGAGEPTSLFRRMLRAMVLRMRDHETPIDMPFADGYVKLKAEIEDLTGLCLERGPEAARELLAGQIAHPDIAAFPAEVAGDRYELRPPRIDLHGRLAQSVHLIPAVDNARAEDEGMWVDRHDPTGDSATLEGWLTLVDHSVALRVYRHEAWQDSPPQAW